MACSSMYKEHPLKEVNILLLYNINKVRSCIHMNIFSYILIIIYCWFLFKPIGYFPTFV